MFIGGSEGICTPDRRPNRSVCIFLTQTGLRNTERAKARASFLPGLVEPGGRWEQIEYSGLAIFSENLRTFFLHNVKTISIIPRIFSIHINFQLK
jgi:hypothetical protein